MPVINKKSKLNEILTLLYDTQRADVINLQKIINEHKDVNSNFFTYCAFPKYLGVKTIEEAFAAHGTYRAKMIIDKINKFVLTGYLIHEPGLAEPSGSELFSHPNRAYFVVFESENDTELDLYELNLDTRVYSRVNDSLTVEEIHRNIDDVAGGGGGGGSVDPFTNTTLGTIKGEARDGYVEHIDTESVGLGHVHGWEKKVDVVDTTDDIVYGKTAGVESTVKYSEDAVENTLVKRTVNKTIKSADATLDEEVTNLKQVNTIKTALETRINNLESIGRYLSGWNATTGKATTEPATLPYVYKPGDYFVVNTVGTNNFKPNGTQYDGTASTTAETNKVGVNDIYRFDGTNWTLTHYDAGSYIAAHDGVGTGTTTLENATITGKTTVADPTDETDAANKKYVDKYVVKYIELTGASGTLTTEQRTTLASGNATSNFIDKDHMIFKCVYYSAGNKAVYSISGESKIHVITVTLPAGTWELVTYELAQLSELNKRILVLSAEPTSSTVGIKGQLAFTTNNAQLYHCTEIDTSVTPNTYKWEEFSGGGATEFDNKTIIEDENGKRATRVGGSLEETSRLYIDGGVTTLGSVDTNILAFDSQGTPEVTELHEGEYLKGKVTFAGMDIVFDEEITTQTVKKDTTHDEYTFIGAFIANTGTADVYIGCGDYNGDMKPLIVLSTGDVATMLTMVTIDKVYSVERNYEKIDVNYIPFDTHMFKKERDVFTLDICDEVFATATKNATTGDIEGTLSSEDLDRLRNSDTNMFRVFYHDDGENVDYNFASSKYNDDNSTGEIIRKYNYSNYTIELNMATGYYVLKVNSTGGDVATKEETQDYFAKEYAIIPNIINGSAIGDERIKEYFDEKTITIVPDDGYGFPEDVEVDYANYRYDSTIGEVALSNAELHDVYVYATCSLIEYLVIEAIDDADITFRIPGTLDNEIEIIGHIDYGANETILSGTTGSATKSLTAGQRLYIMNKKGTLSSSTFYNSYFNIKSSNRFKVSGSLRALLSGGKATMTPYCFTKLFSQADGLISAENLDMGYETSEGCFSYMFERATALTYTPKLKTTELSRYCYSGMFSDCLSLTYAPELPATVMAFGCYMSMFYGCENLLLFPKLNIETLADKCCDSMFYNCTALKAETTATDFSFLTCPDLTGYTEPFKDWLVGTSGSFTGTPTVGTTYYYNGCLKFTGDGSTIAYTKYGTPTVNMQYSTNGTTWTNWDGSAKTISTGGCLYVRNTNNTLSIDNGNYIQFVMTGSVLVSGNIMSLLNNATEITQEYSFYNLFTDCSALQSAPLLPATILAEYCYCQMFYNCSDLAVAPSLPATELAEHCYEKMFYNCQGLIFPPELPAKELKDYCYYQMFYMCTAMKNAPELNITSAGYKSCSAMFGGCYVIKYAAKMPEVITLGSYCFVGMYTNCFALTNMPKLNTTELADGCYSQMFRGCEALETACELPATEMKISCYAGMFWGCKKLTVAPDLIAEEMVSACYQTMFYNCKALVNAPKISATTSAGLGCYQMFYGCSSLIEAPELHFTEVPEQCCYQMFQNCTSLISVPEFEFTSIEQYGCYKMFYNCSALNVSENGIGTKIFTCPTITGSDTVTEMFTSTGGSFTGTPTAGNTYNCYTNIKFTSAEDGASVGYTKNGSPTVNMQYSTNGSTWNAWDGTAITLNNGESIYVKNTNATLSTSDTDYIQFTMTRTISASGSIMSLLNSATTITQDYSFINLFKNCDSLISAPELPSMALTYACYGHMFENTGIVDAPALPATILADSCYANMFKNCTHLINGPAELPANALTETCYADMFNGCTALNTDIVMNVTSVSDASCIDMFANCSSLVSMRNAYLSASAIKASCYFEMFKNCVSLTRAPEIPTPAIQNGGMSYMFSGCSSLKVKEGSGDEIIITIPGAALATDMAGMFDGTGGEFIGTPTPSRSYYYVN